MGDFHLNSSSSWNEESLLDEGSDDTEGIMERSLGLLKHKLVRSSNENRNSLVLRWASSDLDNLLVRSGTDLLNNGGSSKLLRSELIDMRNWDSVDSLADEWDIFSLDILNDHDVLLGKEMKG